MTATGSPRTPEVIGDIARLGALRHPRRVALKLLRPGGPAVVRTFLELDERSTLLANALLGSGLRAGDRIAAWMEDAVEYVEVYFAAAKAGFVVVPISPTFRVREARHIVSDSGCAALFCTAGVAQLVAQVLPDASVTVVAVGDAVARAGQVHYDDLLATGSPDEPAPPPEDSALVIGYTSGTSGTPKGAVLTHRALRSAARSNAVAYRLQRYGTCMFSTTMSFVAAVAALIMPNLYMGATVVMAGALGVDDLVDGIEREGATFTYVPSPRVGEFADAVRAHPGRIATLTCILHAGSKIPAASLRDLVGAAGPRVVEAWGMTEHCGAPATATTPGDYGAAAATDAVYDSVGRALPDVEVQVVDDRGRPLPPGRNHIGEIRLRSPALMSGYWNRPDATASAMRDGWFHTGDLGALDEEGYLYISDRRDDLIVSGGLNVYPSEVEAVIAELPQVRECAVVGAPHERWGSAVVAVVVPGADELTEQAVIEHCRRELAPYKKPTRVMFVDALPRTHSQKVLRRQIREWVGDAGARTAD